MSKLTIFVPYDGMLENVNAYFANNGVHYLYPIKEHITTATAPVNASDETVAEIAEPFVQEIADYYDVWPAGTLDVYEFADDNGERLGWEVLSYVEEKIDHR